MRSHAPHYPGNAAPRLRLDIVDGLQHVITGPEDIARARALASAWFLRFMKQKNEANKRGQPDSLAG